MRLIKEPIPDIHYAIIICEKCRTEMAKLFRDCQGCYVNENFYSLCEECHKEFVND